MLVYSITTHSEDIRRRDKIHDRSVTNTLLALIVLKGQTDQCCKKNPKFLPAPGIAFYLGSAGYSKAVGLI